MTGVLVILVVFGYANSAFKIPVKVASVEEAGNAVNALTEKDALLIVSGGHPFSALYYCQRNGWGFNFHEKYSLEQMKMIGADKNLEPLAETYIETLRKKGASYFIHVQPEKFFSHKNFSSNMIKKYKTLKYEKGKYIILDLRDSNPQRVSRDHNQMELPFRQTK